MADDNEDNMEFQSFELYRALYDKVADFYRYFQDRWGFYFADQDERTRVELKADDTATKFTLTNKDGDCVIKLDADEEISFLNDGKMGWKLSLTGLKWYDANGVQRLLLDEDGLELTNADATVAARYQAVEMSILTDAANFVQATSAAVGIKGAGVWKIYLNGSDGAITGRDGTRTYLLDPADLTADASFKPTEFCTNQEGVTIDALRTDPPE